jgi:general secretion pathway protein G
MQDSISRISLSKTTSAGFTLIELLVVIVILGILAAVVLVLVDPVKRIGEARDAGRRQAIGQIRVALDEYYTKHGYFPDPNMDASRGGWDDSDIAPFIATLSDEGFLKKVPVDPINDSNYHFSYFRYSAGYDNCDPASGPFYVLGIRKFEGSSLWAFEEPGQKDGSWSCPGDANNGARNWGAEFAAVYGEFEK